MGVSTEMWRARIGAFLPVMRKNSALFQRRVWPVRKRIRTYKRPPDETKTHHVTLKLFLCLLMLLIASLLSHNRPLNDIKQSVDHWSIVNGVAIYYGVAGREKRTSWEEGLTIGLRIALFVMLLLCGDVESNPGPNGDEPMGARSTEFHTTQESSTTEQSGSKTSIFEKLRQEFSNQWEGSVSSFLKGARHKKVHEIQRGDTNDKCSTSATSLKTLWKDVKRKWKDLDPENYILTEEDGTEIYDDIYYTELDIKAPLKIHLKSDGSLRFMTSVLDDLQNHLREYYIRVMGFIRRVPWMKDSALPITDVFKIPALYHRIKTSKRESTRRECVDRLGIDKMRKFFDNLCPLNDSKLAESEKMTFLHKSHNDIFLIQQNDRLPHRIVISGYPGVGKTTLLKKLAYDWAIREKDSVLKCVKLFVHLSLADVSKGAMLGEEILNQRLSKSSTFTGEQIEECLRHYGEDIILVFDGFDESVFASLPTDVKETDYGSLYAALKYEQFQSNRIVVTNRQWKKYQFTGDLYNPYAEIVIMGFAPKSINAFITDYCINVHDEQKVRNGLATDLSALQPIVRIPLFLVMICQMIVSDFHISPPFTLTKLMQHICDYLLKTYKEKCINDKKYKGNIWGRAKMYECFELLGSMVLGEIHVNSLTSALISGGMTPADQRELINFACNLGIISLDGDIHHNTTDMLKLPRSCFMHELIVDFCIAHTFLSYPNIFSNSDVQYQLASNNITGMYYVLLFLAGMEPRSVSFLFHGFNTGDDILPIFTFGEGREGKFSSMGVDLLVNCYFEGQLAGKRFVDMSVFNRERTIMTDLLKVNALSATRYLLSSNVQSTDYFYFTRFVFRGDSYLDPTMGDPPDEQRDYILGNLRLDSINYLISKCPFLTFVYLGDLTMAIDNEPTNIDDIKCKTVKRIDIAECVGLEIVKCLLRSILTRVPNLMDFTLLNVVQAGTTMPGQMLQFNVMLEILTDIAPSCETICLYDVCLGPELLSFLEGQTNLTFDKTHVLLKHLQLTACKDEIDLGILLFFLTVCCPKLETLYLISCEINVDSTTQKYVIHSSDIALHLVINKCKCKPGLFHLLQITSMFYPQTENIDVVSSEFEIDRLQTPFSFNNLESVCFNRCSAVINIHDIANGFCCNVNVLPILLSFCRCSITCTPSGIDLPDRTFETIEFVNCSFTGRNIEGIMSFSRNVFVSTAKGTVAGALVLAHGEDDTIHASFSFDTPLTADDIIEKISLCGPCVNTVYILTELVTSSYPGADSFLCSSVEQVLFYGKTNTSFSIMRELPMVSLCFPTFSLLTIQNKTILFDTSSTWSNEALKQVIIEECRRVNFVDIMSFLHSGCPTATHLFIKKCELIIEDNNSRAKFLSDDKYIRRVLDGVSFDDCSHILNIQHMIMVAIANYTDIKVLQFSNCSIIFPNGLETSNLVHFETVIFKDCTFPLDCIYSTLQCCNDVTIINRGIRITLSLKTTLGLQSWSARFFSDNSDRLIDINDLQNVQAWRPDVRTLSVFTSLDNFPPTTLESVLFYSAQEFMISNWNEPDNNRHIIHLMSTCCPNLMSLVINDCNIPFDEYVPGSHTGIKMLIIRKCNRVRFWNIANLFSSCCPSVHLISFQDCESAFHCGRRTNAKILLRYLQQVILINSLKPVNITDVIISLTSSLRTLPHLIIKNSHISYSADINTLCDDMFQSASFTNCTFSSNVMSYMSNYCRTLIVNGQVQVHQ